MTVLDLVSRLRDQDVRLWVDGEQLRFSAPKNALSPELRAELVEHKSEVLQLLREAEDRERESSSPLTRTSRDRRIPLSHAQQRLWFLEQLAPGTSTYNMPCSVWIQGELNQRTLEQALNEIVRRHEALRTVFPESEGAPHQQVLDFVPASLAVRDLGELPEAEREREAKRLASEEADRPFDLVRGPLLRFFLIRLRSTDHILVMLMHHIVSDGWSIGVILRELATIYEAILAGGPSPLPELAVQYADYACWQRRWLQDDVLRSQLAYWRRQLEGPLPVLTLPIDHPRPAVQTHRGAVRSMAIPRELSEALKALCSSEGVTLNMLLLAAFKVLLHRYTAQEDLVVGSPVAGRDRREIEELVGFFVKMLVLRTDLSGNPPFKVLLQRVKDVTLGALAHQDVPFEMLVDALQPERQQSYSPLFQVAFAYQASLFSSSQARGGLIFTPAAIERRTAKFDLMLVMSESNTSLEAEIEYNTDLFDEATIDRMLGHFETVLGAIASDPDCRISDVPILKAEERHRLVVEWNQTGTPYPRGACIQELFEAQVERTPESVAVRYEDAHLTYRELNRRANQVAHRLRKLGVRTDSPVGLYMDRSPEMIVAILGILKAGGAYVPLDPTYPPERLGFMIRDAAAPVLIVQKRLLGRLPPNDACVLCIDSQWESIGSESTTNPGCAASPDSLAYVIYTSGSTGVPKGVAVPHRAVIRLVCDTDFVQLGPSDRVAQVSNSSFDAATFEIWGALLNGGQLIGITKDLAISPQDFARSLIDERISAIFLTVALFNLVAREAPHAFGAVRHFMFGGEAADPAWVREVLRKQPPERLINGYGPTENTTFTACHVVTDLPDTATSVPIGRPIANTTIYILDRRLNPVPVGAPGELYTGGDGLARCYLSRPELTAERFIPDPFCLDPGRRLYRTGDLARHRPDGVIEFLGRVDHQVKIRGFRIELGEIEACLAEHPDVQDCVVLAREDDPGEKRLVAYLVPREGHRRPSGDVRAWLRAKLPEYMVPAAFVMLDSLPLTPNGKVDRDALPAPEGDAADAGRAFAGPRTPVEEVVAGIWADVLKLDRIGIHDSFFDLGGHSLLATQVISRVRQALRVDLPLRRLFDTPTVSGLADALERALRSGDESEAPPIVPASREADLPLSFAQQRLWFLDQWESESPFYSIPLALRLTGALDIDVMVRCLNEIVGRHESLRTTFRVVGDVPRQVIAPPTPIPLPLVDLRHLPPPRREAEMLRLASAESHKAFDLGRGPLIRSRLLRLRDEEHVLLLTIHHIVADGWSLGVLFRELDALYDAFRRGDPSPLPPLAIQYADFANWQREWLSGDVLERHIAYWREKLGEDVPSLALPTDRPRPPVQSFRGANCSFALQEDLCRALRTLCQREGVTLFMALLGAFQTLLHRYSGQDVIVVGSPISNRTRVETEPLIGFFANTLALRTDMDRDPSFRELLGRVREIALGAYAHQDLPFEKLVEELHPDRDMSHTPLFQVMFVLQNATQVPRELSGLALELLDVDTGTAKFDLTLSMAENERVIDANFEYNTDLFEHATIERMADNFRVLLSGIVADPSAAISELPLLTEAERHRILSAWNDSRSEYPGEQCIHEFFEAQAERTPEASAVVFQGRELTYRELNARANQLAHHLRRNGVGPDVLVGICIDRSLEMAIGLLGVLKAGGAYVPLDPAYPKERLAFMLADARVSVLLTRESLRGELPASGARIICLDNGWEAVAAESPANLESGATADNLSYVIYTSGSTGQPKGVVLTHRTLTNLVTWQLQDFFAAPNARTLQFAPPSFDVSCQEIFSTWSAGGTLVLIPEETRRDGWALLRFLNSERIERLFVPFVALQQVAEMVGAGGPLPAHLGEVITAGEQLLTTTAITKLFGRLSDCALANQYGPSEAHVVTAYALSGAPSGWPKLPPIGRPIANTGIYILDRRLQPVPIGVAGELYIGGDGLARGYLNRPEATAERFIPHPFSAEPGARLYRTGDLARHLPDGAIEFLGRIDQQVKVRGFRIELGEIEIVLERHAGVRQAVVVLREDADSPKRLVGYIVPEDETHLEVDELRGYLKEKLPEYMVPAALIVLKSVPLTPSGKVDRRRLPAPDWMDVERGREYVAPRTPVEEVLAGTWANVLGAGKVSVNDNFFDLGGHSLLATQIISRVRTTFGVEIPLRRIFESPTVTGLAESIETEMRSGKSLRTPPLRRAPRDDGATLPLSFAQQRLWFLNQLEPDSASYNIPTPMRLRGPLNVKALSRALDEIVRRHESLRTHFEIRAGEPVQIVDPPSAVPLPLLDLSDVEKDDRHAEAARAARDHAQLPFKLASGPLFRAALLRLAEDDHVLLLTMHHIVSDAWSLGVLTQEIATLYDAYSDDLPSPLPDLPVQYGDYAVWLREWLKGETLDEEMSYWKTQLGGSLPVLDLPTDHPRPRLQTFRGRVQSRVLADGFAQRLDALCRREAVTPFMFLLAAFKTLLLRYTGTEDIIIGSPIANRSREEIEGLIGFFVNTLVLRTDLSGDPTFEELLRRVRDATLGAYAHQDVPFEKLVETLQPERDPGRNPIFQVMFALQNAPEGRTAMKGISIEPFECDSTVAHFDLSLVISRVEGDYVAWLEYNTDLFDDETMARVLSHYECLVNSVTRDPGQRLFDVALWPGPKEEAIAELVATIEESIRRQPGVKECIVLHRESPRVAPRFAAFVACEGTCRSTQTGFDGLSITMMDRLPRSEDGRVDRPRLLRMADSGKTVPPSMSRGGSEADGWQQQAPGEDVRNRKKELAARRARLSAAKGAMLEKRLRGEV
ncbi:MAG: amino acid adenylation domain-containing protein [Acidobacteriota bacterium]